MRLCVRRPRFVLITQYRRYPGTVLDWPRTQEITGLIHEIGADQLLALWRKERDRHGDEPLWGDEVRLVPKMATTRRSRFRRSSTKSWRTMMLAVVLVFLWMLVMYSQGRPRRQKIATGLALRLLPTSIRRRLPSTLSPRPGGRIPSRLWTY